VVSAGFGGERVIRRNNKAGVFLAYDHVTRVVFHRFGQLDFSGCRGAYGDHGDAVAASVGEFSKGSDILPSVDFTQTSKITKESASATAGEIAAGKLYMDKARATAAKTSASLHVGWIFTVIPFDCSCRSLFGRCDPVVASGKPATDKEDESE
jgi:hypothetical protein